MGVQIATSALCFQSWAATRAGLKCHTTAVTLRKLRVLLSTAGPRLITEESTEYPPPFRHPITVSTARGPGATCPYRGGRGGLTTLIPVTRSLLLSAHSARPTATEVEVMGTLSQRQGNQKHITARKCQWMWFNSDHSRGT